MIANNPSNNKFFFLVVVAVIMTESAHVVIFLFTPLNLMQDVNFSLISNWLGVANFLWVLFAFPAGWLSDSIGRVRTITIGAVISTLSGCLALFSQNWQMTIFAYVLSRIASSIIWVAFWVYMAENAPPKSRGIFMGTILGCGMFFNQKAQQFTADLFNRFGENASEIVGTIMLVLTLVLLAWISLQDKNKQKAQETINKNSLQTIALSLFIWLLVVKSISQIGLGGIALNYMRDVLSDALNLNFDQSRSLTATEFSFAGTTIMLFAMIISGVLSDKFGEHKTIAIILLLAGVGGYLPFMILKNFQSAFSQMFVVGLCDALLTPPLASFTAKILPGDKRGATYGLLSVASGIIAGLLLPIQYANQSIYVNGVSFIILLLLILAYIAYTKLRAPAENEKASLDAYNQ